MKIVRETIEMGSFLQNEKSVLQNEKSEKSGMEPMKQVFLSSYKIHPCFHNFTIEYNLHIHLIFMQTFACYNIYIAIFNNYFF